MKETKVAIIKNRILSIVFLLLSIAILFFFGLTTIFFITDPTMPGTGGSGVLIILLLFDLLGIFLFYQSRKRSKLVKGFRTYVSAISNDAEGSISNIAASLGVSEDLFSRDIENMINKKFFTNAFIDRDANRIIINRSQYSEGYAFNSDDLMHGDVLNVASNDARINTAPEVLSIKCKSCGGLNTIMRGEVRECDYCGSSIRGE